MRVLLVEDEVRLAENVRRGLVAEGFVVDVVHDGNSSEAERVFHRFVRLDASRQRAVGGAGLGLAIAREIAWAHSGDLSVVSRRGGAHLRLRLPTRGGEPAS